MIIILAYSFMKSDRYYMDQAVDLAIKGAGRTRPNPPVGAVLVAGGIVVGKGYHRKAGQSHAEVEAIRDAGIKASGSSLYVTLEPCSSYGKTPPCVKAIIKAGIKEVFIGVRDPNPKNTGRGVRALRKAGIKVVEGISRDESQLLIEPFSKWIASKRPQVTLKIGMTIDGRIADPRGQSKWITCDKSRNLVHNLRRHVDAIIVGSRTAKTDDPSLLCAGRRDGSLLRIIVDSRGSLPLHAKVLNDSCVSSTILATTNKCSKTKIQKYKAKGAQVWVLSSVRGGVSIPKLMDRCGREGLLHVLCEGGGELAYSFIMAEMVDQYFFFIAPKVLGGKGSVPSIGGHGWSLKSAPNLEFVNVEQIGKDIMVTAKPL